MRACTLLRMKDVAFVEKNAALLEVAAEMLAVTGSSLVPQIIIHGRCIGGFDVLGSLELRGELDRLLAVSESKHLSTQTK